MNDKGAPDDVTVKGEVLPATIDEFDGWSDFDERPATGKNGTPSQVRTGRTLAESVAPGAAIKPGTRVSRLEIIREIGSGGMGTVYLARDLRLGRRVDQDLRGGGDPRERPQGERHGHRTAADGDRAEAPERR